VLLDGPPPTIAKHSRSGGRNRRANGVSNKVSISSTRITTPITGVASSLFGKNVVRIGHEETDGS